MVFLEPKVAGANQGLQESLILGLKARGAYLATQVFLVSQVNLATLAKNASHLCQDPMEM